MSKDFWKGVLVGFILSLLLIYSFFRIYWIMEVGVKYFRWHATLWLYLSIAFVFLGVGYTLHRNGKFENVFIQKAFLLIAGMMFGLYSGEIYLRLTGNGITYNEEREGVFVNPAERMQKSWYMIYPPHTELTFRAGDEYAFIRHTNSEGLPDKEWITEKSGNEVRVMTFGDSFTQGDGCEFDSSYPKVLERLLQKEFPQVKISVMNAGRNGSDPWFEYKKLHDLLLKYHPDIIVYTNGSNDMFFDHLNYGGMERFATDSTVKNKIPQPKWLGLYEVSYVFRLVMSFIGYDNTLFGVEDREKNKIDALADARLISRKYSELAVKNNFTCIQLIRPDKVDILEGHYEFNLADLTHGTDTLPNYSTFDILQYFRDSLQINKSNVDEYFWRIDQHHNAKGYEAMAKAVYTAVKPAVAKKVADLSL